ncbi:SH3 domain-containing protein [Bacillus velezensis]|uniref:SH3 domain-containing protein n=1 Tax=Bacillus velezensis TaxID=492670 RepID=UPI00223FFE43|nr:SH3 domain-containing protein [Bacillus velezensis]
MTTSSLQSQININTRPFQDAMKAVSESQLELIKSYKKQFALNRIELTNSYKKQFALNRINLLPKMHTSDILKSSGVESALNQMRTALRSTNYKEKYTQQLRNSLMHDLGFNRAQIATYMQQLRTVFKDQAILNSSLYVSNDEISSETISEIDEISDYVEETVIALTNNDGITRQNYFEGLNRLWNTVLYFISKHSTALLLLANLIHTDLISPINQALTSKYIIDEFIEKNPETVSEAKNVLKDIPMNKELKTNYRMVIKDTLVVRTRPKTKSNVSYVLDKSSIVFVEEKKKNWSKVLFRNEAGEDQSGWVYTRYIKKLD